MTSFIAFIVGFLLGWGYGPSQEKFYKFKDFVKGLFKK